MLAGVSTRRFARVGEPVGSGVEAKSSSTSRTSVSELFVERTTTALAELIGHRLDDVRLAVMMLDGIELAERTHVVALGITTDLVRLVYCCLGALRELVWVDEPKPAVPARREAASLDHGCGLVRAVDHGSHDATRSGVERCRRGLMLGAVDAHDGQHGLGAKGAQERADAGGSPPSVFQIDENKLGTGRSRTMRGSPSVLNSKIMVPRTSSLPVRRRLSVFCRSSVNAHARSYWGDRRRSDALPLLREYSLLAKPRDCRLEG